MSQTQQSVTELFSRYLHRQMAAHAEGLGMADPDGQVVPHEAAPMQPVDPQLAWEDALAVWPLLHARSAREVASSAAELLADEIPPDWPSLVAALEPAVALAFCIGNFPQMVRHLQPLLADTDPIALRSHADHGNPSKRPIIVPPTLVQWANSQRHYPQLFVAAGVLRLARRFEEASDLLGSKREVPAAWRLLRANEEAALAWQRGDAEEALSLWQSQKTSVPVLFNRGMASLFLGRVTDAQTSLGQAVAQLPETSAWHHLGHLYLALIAARA